MDTELRGDSRVELPWMKLRRVACADYRGSSGSAPAQLAAWFEEVLLAERKAIAGELEGRHLSMQSELEAKLRRLKDETPTSSGRQPPMLEVPQVDFKHKPSRSPSLASWSTTAPSTRRSSCSPPPGAGEQPPPGGVPGAVEEQLATGACAATPAEGGRRSTESSTEESQQSPESPCSPKSAQSEAESRPISTRIAWMRDRKATRSLSTGSNRSARELLQRSARSTAEIGVPDDILSTTPSAASDKTGSGPPAGSRSFLADDGVVDRIDSLSALNSRGDSIGQISCRLPSARSPRRWTEQLSFIKADSVEWDYGKNWAEVIVNNHNFEMVYAVIITLNALAMACQCQYDGFQLGHELSYRWYDNPAVETWPNADVMFAVLDWLFGILFAAEVVLKMAGLKVLFLKDRWNHFDLTIVLLWIIEQAGTVIPMSTNMLRVARLGKFVRLLRLCRTLKEFDAVYIMTTTLKGSIGALAWSCVLLSVVQMFIAMLLNQVLRLSYFDQEQYPLEERKMVFEYFGTFSRTMLSMFEMTLANWPPVCRLLVEKVSEWFVVFCVLHKLTIGFAVIGVVNGVFIQETFKVASTDDRLMMRQRERELKVHTSKMTRFFKAADESGDGLLDIDEFREIMNDSEILTWMGSMELSYDDIDLLFQLMDTDGDGQLTAKELVQGVMKAKGSAKSIDVLAVMKELGSLKETIAGLQSSLGRASIPVTLSSPSCLPPHLARESSAMDVNSVDSVFC